MKCAFIYIGTPHPQFGLTYIIFVAMILSDVLPLTDGTVAALFPGSATMTATIPSLGMFRVRLWLTTLYEH